MNKLLEKVVLDPANTASLEGTVSFEVTSPVEQIVLEFEVDQPVWMQIFIEKDKEPIGQAVMTHKQVKRTLLIGKELQTTSPTLETQANLEGAWGITCVARAGFSEKVAFSVDSRMLSHDLVIDEESQLDITWALEKG